LKEGLIKVNPADRAWQRPKAKPEIKFWVGAELQRFLVGILDDNERMLYRVAGQRGMRLGELLGLRWRDIDWAHGRISIQPQLGMDVHKATIMAAVAEESGPPTVYGTIANEPAAVRKLVKQLGREARLVAAYEAGPTGYALHRGLTRLGVECTVAAPSQNLSTQLRP
jgi:integrase